jgi:hypothetical protein
MPVDVPHHAADAERPAAPDHMRKPIDAKSNSPHRIPRKALRAALETKSSIVDNVEAAFSRPVDEGSHLGSRPSSNITTRDIHARARQLFESRREARRLRQSLKESGDFLGVQGVNPETGMMDVLTPTTSSDSTKLDHLSPQLQGLSRMMKDAKDAYKEAKRQHKSELTKAIHKREQERLQRLEKEKKTIRNEQRQVHWRKEVGQWSSVAEPNLSPIAQSQRSTTSDKYSSTIQSPSLLVSASENAKIYAGRMHADSPLSMASEMIQQHQIILGGSSPSTPPKKSPNGSSETVIHTPVRDESPFSGHSQEARYGDRRLTLLANSEKKRGLDLDASKLMPPTGGDQEQHPGRFQDTPENTTPVTESSAAKERSVAMLPEPHMDYSFLWDGPQRQTDPRGLLNDSTTTLSLPSTTTRAKETQLPAKPSHLSEAPTTAASPFDNPAQEDCHQRQREAVMTQERKKPLHGPRCPDTPPSIQRDNISRYKAPIASARLSPRKTGTQLARSAPDQAETKGRLIDIGIQSPDPVPRSARPEKCLLDEPVEECAGTRMRGISVVNQEAEKRTQSACTPTTTTTGSDRNAMLQQTLGLDGAVDSVISQKTFTGAEKRTIFGRFHPVSRVSSPHFHPRDNRNASPSVVAQNTAIPMIVTSSGRQLAPTKLRTEKLSPKGCQQPKTPALVPAGLDRLTTPLTSTCTSPPNQDSSRPSHGDDYQGSQQGEGMAQEAAQAAMARARQTSELMRVSKLKEGLRPRGADDGIGDRSTTEKTGDTKLASRLSAGTAAKSVARALIRMLWA